MEKLTNPSYITSLLNRYGTEAKKGFGQNFLISEHVLAQMVTAGDIHESDTIVEVGPGLGVLTRELTLRARHVISIEKDRMMLQILQETILRETAGAKEKIILLEQDALHFDPSKYPLTREGNYKLIANLPYNVATPILENFLIKTAYGDPLTNAKPQPTKIVVLVQKEVAEKAAARTGDHSVLSLTYQPFGEIKIVATVPPGSFLPAPKVTSAILQITPHATPLIPEAQLPLYRKLVHTAFSQKRKMLNKSLQQLLPKETVLELLTKAEISPDIRPQNLPLEKWLTLAKFASEL